MDNFTQNFTIDIFTKTGLQIPNPGDSWDHLREVTVSINFNGRPVLRQEFFEGRDARLFLAGFNDALFCVQVVLGFIDGSP